MVVAVDVVAAEELKKAISARLVLLRNRVIAADSHIDDDVCLVVDDLLALKDRVRRVDVPDSASVHQGPAMEVLRWEGSRNR